MGTPPISQSFRLSCSILISRAFIPTLSYPGRVTVTNKLLPWYQLHHGPCITYGTVGTYGTCKLNR